MATNIDKLVEYLESNKAKEYPIGNSRLQGMEDYIVNGYFKLLATVLQQGGRGLASQTELYKRWLAGAKVSTGMEEYIRQALAITVDEAVTFLTECRSLDIRYRLVLDMLIMITCDTKEESQTKLVALYCEALHITKSELTYMTKLARAIVTMDSKLLADLEEDAIQKKKAPAMTGALTEYATLVAPTGIYSNKQMTVIRQMSGNTLPTDVLDKINTFTTPIVKISAARISVADYQLWIEGNVKHLILEDCDISGGDTYAINVGNLEQITIQKCHFHNFNTRVMEYLTGKATIVESSFTDCYAHGDFYSGGVIYSEEVYSMSPVILILDRVVFTNCGVKNRYSTGTYGIITDEKNVVIDDCQFINCWSYVNENQKEERQKYTLFLKGAKATNCTVENSAPLIAES